MTTNTLPLIELFYRLRKNNLLLGIDEYLLVLNALTAGYIKSRDDLIQICKIVWGKSKVEQEHIGNLLNEILPPKLSDDEMSELLDQEVEQQEESLDEKRNAEIEFNPFALRPRALPSSRRSSSSSSSPHNKALDTKGNISLNMEHGQRNLSLFIPDNKHSIAYGKYDFVGSLPLTYRHMKRAWRYYRRTQRTGLPTEIDVHATVNRIHQTGIHFETILTPRRINTARILIFKDHRGSMAPFEPVVDQLLKSVQGNGFSKVQILYFQNVPGEYVYIDASMIETPIKLKDALGPFSDAGILIVSDAGAARGYLNESRVSQTKSFLKIVKGFTKNIAWLNPTPKERWSNTTAEAIWKHCDIPMFMLSRADLDMAVDVLRGRAMVAVNYAKNI